MKILLLGLKADQYKFLLNGLDQNGHSIIYGLSSQSDRQIRDMIKRADFVLTSRNIQHKYQHTARSLRVSFHTCFGGISSMRTVLQRLLLQPSEALAA